MSNENTRSILGNPATIGATVTSLGASSDVDADAAGVVVAAGVAVSAVVDSTEVVAAGAGAAGSAAFVSAVTEPAVAVVDSSGLAFSSAWSSFCSHVQYQRDHVERRGSWFVSHLPIFF